jgi:hypothetical protein
MSSIYELKQKHVILGELNLLQEKLCINLNSISYLMGSDLVTQLLKNTLCTHCKTRWQNWRTCNIKLSAVVRKLSNYEHFWSFPLRIGFQIGTGYSQDVEVLGIYFSILSIFIISGKSIDKVRQLAGPSEL